MAAAELWDLTRPLEGSCLLELKTFDDTEGKMVRVEAMLACVAVRLWLTVQLCGCRVGGYAFVLLRGGVAVHAVYVCVHQVFWHSSAHVLGECLECGFGAKLCIGPPTSDGFYYGMPQRIPSLPCAQFS